MGSVSLRTIENRPIFPKGAIPIENPKGTAPGFIVEGPTWVTLTIPGVPSEMEYLMENAVIPYLRKRFQLERQVIRYKVLRACGIGESALGLQIEDLMKEGRNPSVGTLAAIGDIRIRITAKAEDPGEADQLISETEQEIRSRLGTLIYGIDQETLQGNTLRILEERGLSLSVIETFTGGVVSQKMAATGSSSFVQGMVLPAPVSQRKFLGISGERVRSSHPGPNKDGCLIGRKSSEDHRDRSRIGPGRTGNRGAAKRRVQNRSLQRTLRPDRL